MTALAIKLTVAPGFVVATSLVSRRYGGRVAGVVGGLPMIAGPILFVLALDQGPAFAARAAVGTLLGVVALAAFVLVYALAAGRFGWAVSTGASWLGFLGVIMALRPVSLGAWAALACAFAALAATSLILSEPPGRPIAAGPAPRWDLPLRALCTVVPVVAVTAAAPALGPHLSGLVSAVPVITPVLTAFTHARHGRQEAVALLRGFTIGFLAYALFCFVVATTLVPVGVAGCFAAAAVVALVAQAVAATFSYRAAAQPVGRRASPALASSSRLVGANTASSSSAAPGTKSTRTRSKPL